MRSMGSALRVIATLTLASFFQSVEAVDAPPTEIDADGTAHIPALQVPFSDLTSPEARKSFVETMQRRKDVQKLVPTADPAHPESIQAVRRALDEYRMIPGLARLRSVFAVNITPERIAGVQTDVVLPKTGVSAANKHRVLINLHGGGMTAGARFGGQMESVPIASLAGIKVITLDYRMAPEWHFPAASEDVASVYRALLKSYPAPNIGIYGCSSGAQLTAQAVAWFQTHNLPRPGAIGLFGEGGTGEDRWGDSNYMSGALGGYGVRSQRLEKSPTALDYLGSTDRNDPMVAPAYHDDVLRSFPPTLLISGTRDVALSTVLYAHAHLVDVGVHADLHVWEGTIHCAFAEGEVDPNVPETRQTWKVITHFFDQHLGREPIGDHYP